MTKMIIDYRREDHNFGINNFKMIVTFVIFKEVNMSVFKSLSTSPHSCQSVQD
jgi:hypothetical protein